MPKNTIKKSIFTRLRNNFIAGVVVLIPIGITLYLTLWLFCCIFGLTHQVRARTNYLYGCIIPIAVLLVPTVSIRPA